MDVLTGLRPTSVVVELGGWEYTVPALPAADWITAVLAQRGGSIVPGLLSTADRRDVWRDFVAGEFDEEELADVERDALAVAAGRPWWEADGLIRSLVLPANWPTLHGEMMLRGLDFERLSLAAALNATYALVCSMLASDKAALSQFEARLRAIPAGVQPEDVYDQAEAADGWLAAMSEQRALSGG